ncbi:hypothetical protein NQ318_011896 [Aromia moschata]|uniref:Uncharacterized protein n=1 Tax=Aromia moschata TaxID=1265417 RepID=A0AAV8YA33_9CUCU|nr:hypothetical protein NQ318_011896 [Aromia moschata]
MCYYRNLLFLQRKNKHLICMRNLRNVFHLDGIRTEIILQDSKNNYDRNIINPDEGQHVIVGVETEINVLAYVQFDPTVSIRKIEQQWNVSKESARRILKKHGYKPYKYHLCNHMYENDFQRRLQYCQWLINNQMDNPNFVRNILFSDKSRFTNLGLFNRNNLRYYAIDNPRLIRKSRYQERFGFNVWLGLLGNRIIGPIIFDGILTEERYLGFLQIKLKMFWKIYLLRLK